MLKITNKKNIEYTLGDTFSLKVGSKTEDGLKAGMQLCFRVAASESSDYIIDKTINISDDLTFTITLNEEEKSRLSINTYHYKMTVLSDNTKITQKSGYFEVKWGA